MSHHDAVLDTETTSDPIHADQNPGLGRRLVVALVLGAALSIACWVFLPRFGVHISPLIPLGVVALIFVPYLLSVIEAGRAKKSEPEDEDEGRPIGCCGPRPVGRILTQRLPAKPDDGCCHATDADPPKSRCGCNS